MLPTLRELLALPAYAGAELLSGHAQLEQQVTWVHVTEVLDAHRFLSGGEVLLATGVELARASNDERTQYVRSLAEGGARALALELVQFIHDVPDGMLHAARLFDFPLIVFRHEVRFAVLTRAAHERILRPHEAPERGEHLAPVLAALAETGRGATFLRQQLGPLLTLPVRPRATLLATLDALLGTHFNVAQVARNLGVRRQTVYYRLEQLRGMLGDLDDHRRQLALAVALELCREGSRDAHATLLDTLSLEPRGPGP